MAYLLGRPVKRKSLGLSSSAFYQGRTCVLSSPELCGKWAHRAHCPWGGGGVRVGGGAGFAATVTQHPVCVWGREFNAGMETDVNPDLSLSFSHYQVDILISVWLTSVTISQLV